MKARTFREAHGEDAWPKLPGGRKMISKLSGGTVIEGPGQGMHLVLLGFRCPIASCKEIHPELLVRGRESSS